MRQAFLAAGRLWLLAGVGAGLKNDPLQVEATPLDLSAVSTEPPVVAAEGTVHFFGQEETLAADAAGTQQASTTPSPYVTVPVLFEYALAPWTSALEKVNPDVTVDAEVEKVEELRALNAWLQAQSQKR